MTRTNRRVPNRVSELPPNPIIRPASQPSDVSSLPTHGFLQQPPPADPTSTVEVEDVHSQNTPPRSTDSRAESLFPEQQSVQRRGGHDPPSTAPTPYVDSNGDVQGLSPYFNPRRPEPPTHPPQARNQADDVSAITQQQPQPQDDRLMRTLDQMLDCLNVLLSRSDHLSQRNEHHGVSFARQHTPPTAESRQSLDLPLKTIVYQGTEMTNSPVLLRPGDQAYWKYGNELMRSVEIIETTLPTVLRRQPIYHIKCANGQEYDVRHDDLFISRTNAMELDSNGVIRSNASVLSASDQLDLHAIDGPHPSHLSAVWAGLRSDQFKLHNLKTHLKDFALDDDSIVSIVNAYEFISQAITAASTTGVVKLPDITELSPDVSIRDLFLPPPSYPRYTTAKACYQNIAGSLSILFQSRDFAAKAPKTRLNLLSIRSQDGIDQLNHILRTRIPTLGATDFQPYQSIMELKVEDNMLLITFIKQAKDLELQLAFSAHPIEDNTLFGHFLKQLMLTNCHTFVAHVFAAFNKFLKRHGSQKKYTDDSIDSVSQDLLDANAPTVLVTLDTLNSSQDVNNPSGYRERLAKKKALSAISRMKYAALTIPEDSAVPGDSVTDGNPDASQDNAGDHDDSTAADEEFDLTEAEMEQATDQANIFYSAIIEQDSYTGDKDDLYNTLLFKAMSNVRQHRGPCEVCDEDHSADICNKRGKAFQPDWMQKRVAQKNLIDGDTPKVEIPQTAPPPRASFSKFKQSKPRSKPQYKVMSLGDPAALEKELDSIQASIESDGDVSPQLASATLASNATGNENEPAGSDFHDQQAHFC